MRLRSRTRRKHRWALALSAAAAAAASSIAGCERRSQGSSSHDLAAEDQRQPYGSPSSYSSDRVNIYIAGYEYSIPKNYLEAYFDNPGKRQSGVLLAVSLPEFEPRTPESRKKFSTRATRIMIHVKTPRNGVVDQGYFLFLFQIELGKEGSPHAIAPYEKVFRDDGLVYFRPIGREPPSPRNDLYAGFKPNGDLDIIIDCRNDYEVPNPGCIQKTLLDDVIVQVTYNKSDLPKWSEYRRKTESLIRSFRVGPAPVADDE